MKITMSDVDAKPTVTNTVIAYGCSRGERREVGRKGGWLRKIKRPQGQPREQSGGGGEGVGARERSRESQEV